MFILKKNIVVNKTSVWKDEKLLCITSTPWQFMIGFASSSNQFVLVPITLCHDSQSADRLKILENRIIVARP